MTSPSVMHSTIEWDLVDRLAKSLRIAGMERNDMAAELDVHRNTIGKWMRGDATPDRRTLISWAMRCGVPFEWLAYGKSQDDSGPDGGSDLHIRSSGWIADTVDLASRRKRRPDSSAA